MLYCSVTFLCIQSLVQIRYHVCTAETSYRQATPFWMTLVLYFGILTVSVVQVKVLLGMTSSRKQQWRC